jgi:hypothetical protein
MIVTAKIAKWVALISLGFGALFYLVSLFCHCTDKVRHLNVALLGGFVGALAVPEIDKRLLKNKFAYQTTIGVLLGVVLVYLFGSDTEMYLAGIIIGGVFGASTPIWIKGLQLPC